MDVHALSTLRRTLSSHVDLGKTRLETLCLLILGMISARTVNLSHLAAERPGHALIASTYRRLQRFFQHVSLADDWAVALVTALLGHTGPWYLCLDRTNRLATMAAINPSVCGPMQAPHLRNRSGVHSAYLRWELGMRDGRGGNGDGPHLSASDCTPSLQRPMP